MACMKPVTCCLVITCWKKSESVVYVPVEMPHKRSRRLKNHGKLVNLAEKSPDSEDIFMEDIVSCNYPNRPDDLEDLCLHDFVTNYDSHSKDSQGRRIYRKVTKPRLVSQKMFDPKKEDKEKAISIHCCFSLYHSEMNHPCFKNRRQPRKPSNVSFLQMWNAVPIMLGCRPC